MADRLLMLQQPDGSWHASLLDPGSYPVPEMSATAFFVFGMAWGVDNGYLDKSVFLPAVMKGWKIMVQSVWPDGKVGYIQPIGADPRAVTSEMTEVYGVGGFLMAGTQILKMAEKGIFKNY
jgi:rhamnogalacturonyl hydrolase YesR